MLELKDCRIDGSDTFKIKNMPTNAKIDKKLKADFQRKAAKNLAKMELLQSKLYADNKEGIVIMLQAMDAAGKDSTIKNVMSGINPQGIDVTSFKQPSSLELAHDYLWRANRALPERGKMAIFNRSYYEDVLVVRVHKLQETYDMPKRCVKGDDFFEKRYEQIRHYEEYLYENGYRLLKIFLNVSKAEQKKRFLERIDDETKNWKFSSGDIKERALWDDYMKAYEDAINGTATKHSPWYIIPADQKWFTRWLVSEAVVDILEACDPQYPVLAAEEQAQLAESKKLLLAEKGGKSASKANKPASAPVVPAVPDKSSVATAVPDKASEATAAPDEASVSPAAPGETPTPVIPPAGTPASTIPPAGVYCPS